MRRVSIAAFGAWVGLSACGGDDPAVSGESSGPGETESSPSSGAVTDATGPEPTTSPGATSSTGEVDGTTAAVTDADTGDAFVLDVHTVLTDDGRLALTTNLPATVEACDALAELEAPCDDVDLDGLVDAWEDLAIDRLRPLRRFDEAEALFDDAMAVLADVGRVAPADDGVGIRLYVMLGYSSDYGSCGFTAHNGDSERVVLALDPWRDGGAGGVVVAQAYTAAHEGTANDHGQVFSGADLDQLVFTSDPTWAEPRWVVYPSRDKHATYASVEICEGISIVPCIEEDCAPDGVGDPSAFDVVPDFGNAGEEAAPRLTDLSSLGFAGDDAWADQDFCGGLGGGSCSSSVRSKLLTDPF